MKDKLIALYDWAKKYVDENTLYVGIQGEILAPSVQGNKYKKNRPELYVFNIIVGVKDRKIKLGNKELVVACDYLGLTTVPMLPDLELNHTVDEIVELSRFTSTLIDNEAEGIVYRVVDSDGYVVDSWKVINPDFLLKYE